MVLANHDAWDRYQASQWYATDCWLATHPDQRSAAFRSINQAWRITDNPVDDRLRTNVEHLELGRIWKPTLYPLSYRQRLPLFSG
jgi:hypothetical protein